MNYMSVDYQKKKINDKILDQKKDAVVDESGNTQSMEISNEIN